MIYLLYGEDEFSILENLSSMKNALEPPDLRDVNTTSVDGTTIKFEELRSICNTIPFLASKRLVVVTNLLAQFETHTKPNRSDAKGILDSWSRLFDYISEVPETTDLVFVDDSLNSSNTLLKVVTKLGTVRRFTLPDDRSVEKWVRDRAVSKHIEIEHNAIRRLATIIGVDLRIISNELDKLAAYRGGLPIRVEDVEELVSYDREIRIFTAIDALVEGRVDQAMKNIHQLLKLGRSPGYILAMIARQVRLLILAKDLKSRRVPTAELGSRLGLRGYPLRKTLDQEKTFTVHRLKNIHQKLLDTDIRIKTTGTDERLILDLLVTEICVAT